jgi:hypothetical protein
MKSNPVEARNAKYKRSLLGLCVWMGIVPMGLATAQAQTALYGVHGVSPLAVRQGTLGSCYFHASLAAVANAAPDTLRGAITPLPTGGYRVHFTQGQDETVLPEDVEFGRAHSYDRSEGVWVGVLMRAYAQRVLRISLINTIQNAPSIPIFIRPLALSSLNQSDTLLSAWDRAVRAVVSQDGNIDKAALTKHLGDELAILGIPAAQSAMVSGFLNDQGFFDAVSQAVQANGEVFGAYKSLGQGGIPVQVIEAFMGSASAGQISERRPLMEKLRKLHAGGLAMVAGSGTNPAGTEPVGKAEGWWVATHAYTVLDFDETAQTVSLRNPWGARPAPDGVFIIPLSTFLATYDSYSTSAPAAK